MEPILVDRDIAVDDVTILKRSEVRNSMANDLIDTGTETLREFVIVQWTWVSVMRDDAFMDDTVYLIGRHSFLTCSMGRVKNNPSYSASLSNTFYLLWSIDRDD
jgi:hypothetical protein